MDKARDESETVDGAPRVDWAAWIRGLGRQVRRNREFLGLSQEQVAKLSGVSQGAVSRLEGGRGLATPLLVVMKVNAAMRTALSRIDPQLLSEDARRMLDNDPRFAVEKTGNETGFAPIPLLQDPALEDLIRMYRELPERHRQKLLSVVRATVSALLGSEMDAAPERRVSHGVE